MDTTGFVEYLQAIIEEEGGLISHAATFDQAGVLSSDPGIVVKLTDGSEYQCKIYRSR